MTHSILVTEALTIPNSFESRSELDVQPELHKSRDQLVSSIGPYDALIVRNKTIVDEELLSRSKLKVIGRLGAGLENIDVEAAKSRGIQVVYAPGKNTNAVVEFCLSHILSMIRQIPSALSSTSDGSWDRYSFVGKEVAECKFGIVGYGRCGKRLAEILSFMGGQVFVNTRQTKNVQSPHIYLDLCELLRVCDVISLHVPGGEQTRGLLGENEFALMKDGALIINASRGSVIDENALISALKNRKVAAACLDVRESEPPNKGELELLPNAYLTPHIAAFTHLSQTNISLSVLNDVMSVLQGRPAQHPAL